VVDIIRKGKLPQPIEVPISVRDAAAAALGMTLREPTVKLLGCSCGVIESSQRYVAS
jgi:hypothetical protein